MDKFKNLDFNKLTGVQTSKTKEMNVLGLENPPSPIDNINKLLEKVRKNPEKTNLIKKKKLNKKPQTGAFV